MGQNMKPPGTGLPQMSLKDKIRARPQPMFKFNPDAVSIYLYLYYFIHYLQINNMHFQKIKILCKLKCKLNNVLINSVGSFMNLQCMF